MAGRGGRHSFPSGRPHRFSPFPDVSAYPYPLAANASLVAQPFRTKDIDNSLPPLRKRVRTAELSLPGNFDTSGPGGKIRSLPNTCADPVSNHRFSDAGVAIDITQQTIDPRPSVSAGISRYAAFCDLIRDPYLPPTEVRVERWATCFNTGATFPIYIGHLSRGCRLLDIDTSWRDEWADAAINGLRHDRVSDNYFANFIIRDIFVRLVRMDGLGNPLDQLRYLSFYLRYALSRERPQLDVPNFRTI